ncbi:MAG: ABC transporter permease, partial [Nitrospirae bacterium]
LFTSSLTISTVKKSLKRGIAKLGADIMVVPAAYNIDEKETLLSGKPFHIYMDGSVLEKVSKVRGVKKATPQVFLESAPYVCCDTSNAFLVGFDPKTDFTILPWVAEKLDGPIKKHDIITGRNLPYNKGQYIRFYGIKFRIVGTLERTGLLFMDEASFMPLEAAYEIAKNNILKLKPGEVSAVLVQVEPDIDPERVALFIENEVPGVKTIVSKHVISSARKQMSIVMKGAVTIAGIIWFMAILTIGIVFSMIINERQREIGLLRAMGAKRITVFKLLVTESLLLSIFGGLIGIAIGWSIVYGLREVIQTVLKVPYLLPSSLEMAVFILFSLLAGVLTGFIAVFYPAYRASRMEPYAAIRMGE